MKARTVDRLVTRSRGSGRLARTALRRLLNAGEDGDPTATDALWDRWLSDGNDEIGAALSRWQRPHTTGGPSLVALAGPAAPADVVAAACRTGHPIAAMARTRILTGQQDLVDAACEAADLAVFCVEHRLAPADPHRAATFFLLTGQREQYLLADPDHSLLAVTYRGGQEELRARVRARVAGEPALVRVLAEANRRDRMTRLSAPEAAYLTGQLADRRDWPGLWALARDLPVRQAIDAVRSIDGWAPGPADELLFHALARADPAVVAAAQAALVLPWSMRVTVSGSVVSGAFSPDGTRIAVAHNEGVDVHALPSGTREPENSRRGKGIRAVVVLDDALVVTAGVAGGPSGPWGMGFVDRGGGGRPVTRRVIPGEIHSLASRPGGYAALTVKRGHVWLRLQDDDGRQGPPPSSRTVSIGAELPEPASPAGWALTGTPAGDRLAVAGDRVYVLSVSRSMVHVVSTATPFTGDLHPAVAVSGSDRLVARDGAGMVRVWGPGGAVVAYRQLEPNVRPASLVDVPEAGVVAAIEEIPNRRVRLLDGATLAAVSEPPAFSGVPATCLFSLPGTSLVAAGGPGFVQVADLGNPAMAALSDRPLAATNPADLPTLRQHLDRTAPDSAARPVLELLEVCLTHRFGADVAIGDGAVAVARLDDIALGGA